jgi:hypothetical protein
MSGGVYCYYINLPTHGTNMALGARGRARDERCMSGGVYCYYKNLPAHGTNMALGARGDTRPTLNSI